MQTGNQVIFLIYYILHNPRVKERVYKELDEVLPPNSDHITPELIKQLKYLNACKTEIMR